MKEAQSSLVLTESDLPRVSVITPVFNTLEYLQECVDSVMAQTYAHWELWLVDDCSTDGSWEWLIELAINNSRVHVLRTAKNSGAAYARNLGIKAATGRMIAFLDADDRWLPNKLEVQIRMMIRNSWVLSYSSYRKFGDGKATERIVHAPNTVNYRQLLRSNSIGCLTAVYDAETLGKRYMPLVRKRQDWGLWLSILMDGHIAYSVGQVLAEYRVHKSSLSGNKWNAACHTWHFYRVVLGFGRLGSVWYFVQYSVLGLLKHRI